MKYKLKNGGVIKLQGAGIIPKIRRLVQEAKVAKQLNKIVRTTKLQEPVIGTIDRTKVVPKLTVYNPIANELLLSMRSKTPTQILSTLNGVEMQPKEIFHVPKITISEPYARVSRDLSTINEARSFSIDNDPFNTFQLIKDIEPKQYSVHFKTDGKYALSEPQKQQLFTAVADAIPGGSTLSTWGSVSKGGLAGLKRFEGLGFKPTLQFRSLGLKTPLTETPFGELIGDNVEVPILYKPRSVIAGSRPISEAERKGWPKSQRNAPRGSVSPIEYSGLSKGERNNGRYGDIRFIRHLDVVPELTEDGFVQIAPEQNFFANFTTDQIMTTHPDYPVRSPHTIIINPEAFRGNTPFSLDPGDTFFELAKLKIKPKHVTFISGDKDALALAKERGFTVISSPKLKLLQPWTVGDDGTLAAQWKPQLEKRGYWSYGRDWSKIKMDYDTEMERVLNTYFNRPSLKDYVRLEEITGTPSHTYTWKTAPWDTFQGPKRGYQSVIYDTTPSTEEEILKKMGLEMPHPTKEYMGFTKPFLFRVRNNLKPIKKYGGIINNEKTQR